MRIVVLCAQILGSDRHATKRETDSDKQPGVKSQRASHEYTFYDEKSTNNTSNWRILHVYFGPMKSRDIVNYQLTMFSTIFTWSEMGTLSDILSPLFKNSQKIISYMWARQPQKISPAKKRVKVTWFNLIRCSVYQRVIFMRWDTGNTNLKALGT